MPRLLLKILGAVAIAVFVVLYELGDYLFGHWIDLAWVGLVSLGLFATAIAAAAA